jgi:hypothetical protein
MEREMIGKQLAMALAVAGVALTASQAHADTDLSFLDKYIDKYVKDGKIAGFDLNKVTSKLETSSDSDSKSNSNSLSNLRNRLTKKSSTPKALTAQRP